MTCIMATFPYPSLIAGCMDPCCLPERYRISGHGIENKGSPPRRVPPGSGDQVWFASLLYGMQHDMCIPGDTLEGRQEQVVAHSIDIECRRDTARGPTQGLDTTF